MELHIESRDPGEWTIGVGAVSGLHLRVTALNDEMRTGGRAGQDDDYRVDVLYGPGDKWCRTVVKPAFEDVIFYAINLTFVPRPVYAFAPVNFSDSGVTVAHTVDAATGWGLFRLLGDPELGSLHTKPWEFVGRHSHLERALATVRDALLFPHPEWRVVQEAVL
jgi:hypothetical protein